MTKQKLTELVKAIIDDRFYDTFYDWVADNYHLLSKEELKNLFLEYAWSVEGGLHKNEFVRNIIEVFGGNKKLFDEITSMKTYNPDEEW